MKGEKKINVAPPGVCFFCLNVMFYEVFILSLQKEIMFF